MRFFDVLEPVRRLLANDQVSRLLIQRAGKSAVLKFTGLFLGLVTAAMLGRILRPDQYGTYSFAFSMVTLLALPVQVGLPQLLIREVAKYHLVRDWGLMKGILLRANQMVLLLGVVVAVVLALLAPAIKRGFPVVDIPTLTWSAAMLPVLALSQIRGATLVGLQRNVQGQLPENVIRPALFVLFVLLWWLVFPMRASTAMALQFFAALLAFFAGAFLLMRHLPVETRGASAVFQSRSWAKSLLPLTMTDALQVINVQADIFILGAFRSAGEVGVYRAASLIAYQVSIGLSVIIMFIGPYFARLHHSKDQVAVQQLMRRTVFLSSIVGLCFASICLLMPGTVMRLSFGPSYEHGGLILAILAFGQLVNSVTGPGSVLLNMTGHERDVTRTILFSALINVAVNLVLVPHFGAVGAAVTTTVSQIFANTLLTFLLWKRLRVSIMPGGLRRLLRPS